MRHEEESIHDKIYRWLVPIPITVEITKMLLKNYRN